MRRSKEIIVLLALLLGMMGFVVWYVIDRRAKLRLPGNPAAHGVSGTNTGPAAAGNGAPAVAEQTAGQIPAGQQAGTGPSAAPVDLAKHDGQTIDFSSGKPVVRDLPEDKAALDKVTKEMAEATKDVTFEAPKKEPEPVPPKK